MPSNREAYFSAIHKGIPKQVVNFALQEVNGYTFFDLVENYDEPIKNYDSFLDALKRYQNGEMIEYIFNKSYFLAREFYVDKSVLIPRQETEQLVIDTINLIKEKFDGKILDIADVCTGSGVIGLSIANRLPQHNYYLTDIEKEAIRVCKINSKNIDCKNIKVLTGNMLEPLINNNIKLDVLVCNPPYIENENTIDEKTWKQEPHVALLAKPATKFYEEVLSRISLVMKDCFIISFEIGEDMKSSLEKLVKKYCPNCEHVFIKDMYDKTRFLFIKQ